MTNAPQLRPAAYADWPLLLAWRNDPETRRQSLQGEPVAPEAHQAWLQALLDNPNRRLWIGLDRAGAPIGTVRADYDPQADTTEISWTIAPEARGKGWGKALVLRLLEELEGNVLAVVKPENRASARIAEAVGLVRQADAGAGLLHFRAVLPSK